MQENPMVLKVATMDIVGQSAKNPLCGGLMRGRSMRGAGQRALIRKIA